MRSRFQIWFLALGAVVPGIFQAGAVEQTNAPARPLPDAATVVIRILERARQVAKDSQAYTYTKRSTVEELDAKDQVRSTKVKLYEVTQVGGVTSARLIQLGAGSGGGGQQMAAQAQREEVTKERFTQSSKGGQRGRFEQLVTEELFSRFVWKVEQREMIAGRASVRLSFQPRAGAVKADKLMDRVISRMAGNVWVDEQNWEIARADLRLQERVSLWGGLIGSLDSFRLAIQREPDVQNVWYVKRSDMNLTGRKLLGTVRFRAKEISEGFHRSDATSSR